jgi:uncharacterized protein (DUF433 family)
MTTISPDPIIESVRERFGGAPMFKGTGIFVYVIAARLQRGDAQDLILRKHPGLTIAMIETTRRYVALHPFNRGLDGESSSPPGFAEDSQQASLTDYPETPEVQVDSRVMGGTPCIRGTRITVYSIAARLRGGDPMEDLLDEYPYVTQRQFEAAWAYADRYPFVEDPDGRPWRKTDKKDGA